MNDGQLPIDPAVDAVSPENAAEKKGGEAPSTAPPPPPKPQPSEPHQNKTCICRPDQTPWWKGTLEIVTLSIGIFGLIVYWNQLKVMSGQLTQMQGSSGQTDQLIGLYRQQLAQLTKQAGDTHALAVDAGKQADEAGKQAVAAKSMSELTARQFSSSQQVIESQRASISVSPYSVDHPMTFQEQHEMSFAFTLALVNNGAFAANDVRTRYKLYFSKFDNRIFHEPGKRQRELCKAPFPPEPAEIGPSPKLTIYSGKVAPIQINGGWGIAPEDIYLQPYDTQHPNRILPIVVGCVDYFSGAMPTRHQTGFIFEIRRKDGGMIPGVDIPADAISVDEYIFDQGDSY
jgi:hypothetical protein